MNREETYEKYKKLCRKITMCGGGNCCSQSCGRSPYGKFSTCCGACNKVRGNHTPDCDTRTMCVNGCGRFQNKQYNTCCGDCSKNNPNLHTGECTPRVSRYLIDCGLCENGCGRTKNGSHPTCCKYCANGNWKHTDDCLGRQKLNPSTPLTPLSPFSIYSPTVTTSNLAITTPMITKKIALKTITKNDIKILSWNILAPQLLKKFWHNYFDLSIPAPSQLDIDANTVIRTNAMVAVLKSLDCDIICLQEITLDAYQLLNGETIHGYIASLLGMEYYETYKQNTGQTGIATLFKTGMGVEKIDYNKYIKGSGESPFLTCKYNSTLFTNVHLVMDQNSLDKLYNDISSNKPNFILGDLNCKSNFRTMETTTNANGYINIPIRSGDDVFAFDMSVGYRNPYVVTKYKDNMGSDKNIDILTINGKTTKPMTTEISDHYPIMAEIIMQ